MPALVLDDELSELTERMEKILHEELPAAARAMAEITSQDTEAGTTLIQVVAELDDIQRAIGLRTFELLARGALPRRAVAGAATPTSTSADAEFDPIGRKGEAVTITCTACRTDHGVSTCPQCAKPFCTEHVDPAMHPCGDLL